VGKYILTPDILEYIKKAKPNQKGEIVLAEVLQQYINEGKNIYGYEIEGRWLEAGTKMEGMRTNLYLSLKDKKYGKELKEFIRENKLV